MHSIVRSLGAVLVAAVLVIQPAPPALAQGAPFCPPGVSPQFANGFASLQGRLGAIMGEPLECEHEDGASGDTVQQTTTGLAFWRRSTNTPTFTDGYRHWALTTRGLVAWEGSAVDPPATARQVNNPAGGTAGSPAQTGSSQQGSTRGRTEAAAPASVTPGRRTTPTTFTYKTVDQAPANNAWPCQSRNPSCGRETWWAQWNEIQETSPLQFRYIGPGLVSEDRFVEAIALIWLWPEGQELLKTAAEHGVAIYSSPEIARRAFAAYRPATRTLLVNPNFTEVSTWLLANVIAHELKHASDHATGTRMGANYADCVAREQAAFQTEKSFVTWLANRQGGLPSANEVSELLSEEDFALFTDITRTLTSPNLDAQVEESYRSICQGRR